MFGLLYGLYCQMTTRPKYSILLLGLDHSGKTTFLEQVKSVYLNTVPLPPEKISPTVGLNIGNLEIGRASVVCWDLGGQKELRSMWEKYYGETQGVIFVVDAADTARLEEAQEEFDALLREPKLEGVPILVVANKQDIESAISPRELGEMFGVGSAGDGNNLTRVQGVTALTGDGVEAGVDWIVTELRANAREVNRDGF